MWVKSNARRKKRRKKEKSMCEQWPAMLATANKRLNQRQNERGVQRKNKVGNARGNQGP